MKLFSPFARKATNEPPTYIMDRICKPDEAAQFIPGFAVQQISFDLTDDEISLSTNQHIPSIQSSINDAIRKHEAGDLSGAFRLFALASAEPIGLFLCALSVRHGWGCSVDMNLAARCLQRACNFSMDRRKSQENAEVNDVELSMILFELGQSHRYGWGVPKSKENAVVF